MLRAMSDDTPTLYVCHGDEKSPKFHPCGKVQKAMKEKGIAYEKVIGGKGSPIPFLRKDADRQVVQQATGQDDLPALKLPDGTILNHSKAILAWVERQPGG
jgi:glutathione S-transferase